eukprot:5434509-Pleurochrysis_carterae.AAC.1
MSTSLLSIDERLILLLPVLTSDRMFSATLLITASPLEAICTEILISPPGAPLSWLLLSPEVPRLRQRLRFSRV